MKAAPFKYVKPSSIDEALALKAAYGDEAQFLAGGQSLVPMLNMRLSQPEVLIDINGLSELDGVSMGDKVVRVGALTRTKAVGTSDLVAKHLPLLFECVDHIAHPAIRNLGTFGGSVALGDPAAEWPACCLALDADIVLRSRSGERRVAAAEFFQGLYTTALRADELLVRVEFPKQPDDVKPVVLELARRRGDFAIVGIVAQAAQSLDDLRISFLGIADRPVRIAEVEEAIKNDRTLEQANAVVDRQLPVDGDIYHDAATKSYLAKFLLRQAVDRLAA